MEHLPSYLKEQRPWGDFERFTTNEATSVKLITVKPGEALSLQTHAHRDEFWRILSGSGVVTIGDATRDAKPGDDFFCPRTTPHRVAANQDGISFLEIAFGEFDEEDITRLEDRYGRS